MLRSQSLRARLSLEAIEDRITPSGTPAGGLYLAVGNVLPTGEQEVITGAGFGGGPQVSVFDANQTSRLSTFFAYEPEFRGGVQVASGDLTGNGLDEIVTGSGIGGGPVVAAFDGNGQELFRFFAYEPEFRGGVQVAVGDVTGDGRQEIITGAAVGGGPVVAVFDHQGRELFRFFAYEPEFRGGVFVAAADVTGDGRAEIITGSGIGGGPVVKLFSGQGNQLNSFFAFDSAFRGGVIVAAGNTTGDQVAEIWTSPADGGGPHVRAFDGITSEELASFFAYEGETVGGIFMALGDLNGNGRADLLTSSTAAEFEQTPAVFEEPIGRSITPVELFGPSPEDVQVPIESFIATTPAPVPPSFVETPSLPPMPPTPAPDPAPAPDEFELTEDEQKLLDSTNAERKKAGLPELQANPQLFAAARGHSINMAAQKTMAHTLDDKTFGTRIKENGYQFSLAAENVAAGQQTPAEAVEAWMNSPGHRTNLLNKEYGDVGLGVAKADDGRLYWTQVFAKPRP